MATDATIFNKVNDLIADDIKEELRLQGHYLTGALEASIIEKTILENGDIILTAEAAEYIESLEKGIPASEIVIDSKKLAEMTRYVQLRMKLQGSQAAKVAYRILQKQSVEGNPTKDSYQYSKTGKRTEVLKETFKKNENRYGVMIDNTVVGQLDNEFHSIKDGII